MSPENKLEGHARALIAAGYTSFLETNQIVVLHELSRDPSEAEVEAAARAMAAVDGKNPDDPAWVKYPGGQPLGLCWRDQYADKARAALKAARAKRAKEISNV